jgi:hypothetical protein
VVGDDAGAFGGMALYEIDNQDEDWDDEDDTEASEAGTVVTMTEGYGICGLPASARNVKGHLKLLLRTCVNPQVMACLPI